MNEALTIPRVLNDRVIRRSAVTNVMLVVAGSAIIAIAAQIAITVPFSPVPLTLQPLAVLLVAIVLGSGRGAAAAILYLLEGASGAPVFAQFHGGAMWLVGLTAGYLWSYPLAAFIAGWFSERNWGSSVAWSVGGMLIALGIIYIGGWSWLAVFTGARKAFMTGVAPFLIADIIKISIVAAMLPQAQRFVARA